MNNVYSIFTGLPVSGLPAVKSNETDYCQVTIVDRLLARFGDNPIKLGVLNASPFKQVNDVNYIDSYGRGNVHNSIHQYKKIGKNWNRPMPFPSCIVQIEKAFKKYSGKPFTLGYKSDAFMWMDQKYKTTHEVLRLARKYNITLTIETMSDLIAHEDYINSLPKNTLVIMNMGCGETEEQERIDSPGAPSLKRRMIAVQKLKQHGIMVKFRVKKEIQDIFVLREEKTA